MRKILISLLIGSCVLFSFMSCQVLESILGTSSSSASSASSLEDGNYATSAPGFGNAFFEIHDNKFRVIGVEVHAEGVIRVNGDDIEFEAVKTYNGSATGIIGKGKIINRNKFTLEGMEFFFWTPYNPDGTL